MLGLLEDFKHRTPSRHPVLCQLDFTKGSHKPSSKDHNNNNKKCHCSKNINTGILEAQRITEEVNLSSAKANWRREPGTSLLSHPHTYTLHARLSTTTFAAVGNGKSHWTTCTKTRKKEKNSGRAVGQKQARKMSTRQNDATSINKMLLPMTALGRWWCWWRVATPSPCIPTVRKKLRAQTSLQILGCCRNFFQPSFPPLENWDNSTHLVRMLEWINEGLPRAQAPRRHKISGSY